MSIMELLDKHGDQLGIIYLKLENGKNEISKELRESIGENLKKLSKIQKKLSLREQAKRVE